MLRLTRQKLIFMALGSVFTLAGYLLATLVLNATAQENQKSLGYLVCDGITIRDKDGNDRIEMFVGKDNASLFRIKDESGHVRILMGVDNNEATLRFHNKPPNIFHGIIMGFDDIKKSVFLKFIDKDDKFRLQLSLDDSGSAGGPSVILRPRLGVPGGVIMSVDPKTDNGDVVVIDKNEGYRHLHKH